jgi:hypothetical protein
MLDPRYRNPSWVTNQVIDDNCEQTFWSARFRMPSQEAVERVTAALTQAGSARVLPAAATDIVVEFAPVLVRRIATTAVAHGGVLVEIARVPALERLRPGERIR